MVILTLTIIFSLSIYFLFKNENLDYQLVATLHIDSQNIQNNFSIATIKNNEEELNWNYSNNLILPKMDFINNYYYVSNRKLISIIYRRYDKYRLQNPFYYGKFYFSEEITDKFYVYKTKKIWVTKNFNAEARL